MLYAAYGSNMNPTQMDLRCPGSKILGTARLQGRELLFRGAEQTAYATVEPKEDAFVPLVVWEIGVENEIRLDVYEGFPRIYHKETAEIELDGETAAVMLYVMNSGPALNLPSASYFQCIQEGYQSAGLDLSILAKAVSRTVELAVERLEDKVEQTAGCLENRWDFSTLK